MSWLTFAEFYGVPPMRFIVKTRILTTWEHDLEAGSIKEAAEKARVQVRKAMGPALMESMVYMIGTTPDKEEGIG